MSTRTRYILIGIGIVLFIILAPLAIFYARGFRLDFSDGEITKTGALVVKSDPKGAEVLLDGKRLKKTPLTKRFVFPGEYELQIQKNGYQNWQKHITVNSQLITNPAQKGREEIFLFFSEPIETLVSTNTVDFLFKKNEIIFVNTNSEIITTSNTSSSKDVFTNIPTNLENLEILDKNKNYVLIKSADRHLLIGKTDFFELPKNLNNIALKDDDGKVLGTNDNLALVEYSPITKTTEILVDQVDAFKVQDSDIYYLFANSLFRLSKSTITTLLLESISSFDTAEIIISPAKRIFLILDNSLYLVNQELEKINQNVQYATWSDSANALIYGNATESWLFRIQSEQRNELLIRNSNRVSIPQYNSATGYYFILENQSINAIEASFDGQENTFLLNEAENKNIDFTVDSDGEYLVLLDGQNLITFKIR